ncbi:hypothetical protein F2P56_000149 [Juglans regia]|uniref:PsbQ-like protein 3, chloroplastic n=2 Tax=Juglans regia TaxID=51240 RepID=A0A2I4FR70_JUGRE|nr:psbQ-like protein 3, chloroplastic [Juglans regia]XP_035544572.1 psbQ-like protein 3, chloroplastic [Juglans regia]XP_035544574.1 psbQ-like protein 3, chloroplastic [Juglans regia]XP_035544578.1 psbQ-like protein 3, chloroplastic [Juglans regia]KAF5479316.1 hypothetical protein F2P56_000149 [Juglans regia]
MMAFTTPLVLQPNLSRYPHPPTFTCCFKPSFRSREMPQKVILDSNFRRRIAGIAAIVSVLLASPEVSDGFEFNMVVPGTTYEEAKSGIRGHAQALLGIKSLIESESWVEAQKVLRKNSSYLKQDLYTIIQGKPGSDRPELRKLYSNLFNNATKLDYAAKYKDASLVWQCYENIVLALNEILSRI